MGKDVRTTAEKFSMNHSFRKNTLYESLIYNILKIISYVYDQQISQLLFNFLGHELGKSSTN